MPLRRVVLLMTSSTKDIMQEIAQRRILDVLVGKQIDVEVVDGASKRGHMSELSQLSHCSQPGSLLLCRSAPRCSLLPR